ncbi:MAG: terminase family protein [Pseudomonadota bacterium]
MAIHSEYKGSHRWADWHASDGADYRLGDDASARLCDTPFLLKARPSQRPPPGDWRTWLFMAGRGAGKTRAGAEWTRFAAMQAGVGRIALIAPTLSDAREVMIEGPSGLKAVSQTCDEELPVYQVSRRRLEWANGALAYIFSAEDPDSLRGPQFEAAWCDEAAAWRRGQFVWDMLQMALRIGETPRAVVTTTPKPVPLIKSLIEADDTVITRGRTWDNAENLSSYFLDSVDRRYGGTELGRQELDGILLENNRGALWSMSTIEGCRVAKPPPSFATIVVAVDPPITAKMGSDECGIVAVGGVERQDGKTDCYVLADASEGGLTPIEWARRAVVLAERLGANRIIAEVNQGGDMVVQTLRAAGCRIPVDAERAKSSKYDRASPVSALYAQQQIKHVGRFANLEDQMILFGTEGLKRSPDRLDALVWAVTSLALNEHGEPNIRRL